MENREIKFRVWDNNSGRFFEEGVDDTEDWLAITLEGEVATFDTEPYGGVEQDRDRFTVQQFTGLKDKNGKEIYEGDVVNIKRKKEERKNQLVMFKYGCFGWGQDDTFETFGLDDNPKVVGNIFEHPHLANQWANESLLELRGILEEHRREGESYPDTLKRVLKTVRSILF